MATKTQKPEGAAAPELVPIDKLRERHKVGRATYAGVCAANGWRPGTSPEVTSARSSSTSGARL